MTYSAAWCTTFVSTVAIECVLTEIIPVECGCSLMIGLYKKLGRWREDENYIPKVGDIIFYDWDDGKDYAKSDATLTSCIGSIIIYSRKCKTHQVI